MPDPAQPTWLITGALGFLGANIGAFLAGRAHRIGAVRRITPTGGSGPFDEWIEGDLEHPEALGAVIRERRPDVVLHAAALAHHDRCEADPALAHRVNVEASVALAEAAGEAGSRFVLVSTDAVFDGSRGHYAETDPVAPTSIYGRTKVEAELGVMQVTDALVIRTNFFGWSPTGRRSILEFFVNALSAGEQVRGFTDFTTSSAYAQVLAEAIADLTGVGASGVFHVTSPDRMSKYAFGVAVAKEFGLDAALIVPSRADIHPPRNGDISLDVSKAEAVLGRPLPTMREGIARARADAPWLTEAIGAPVR